ncbi:hypothetical protein EDB84DRAFT_1435861 [Lactarius hengduanensis]|nr:hypothetical protein EDB84DRAFT_1435861 [Lactarius hengduanensis]
MLISQVSCMNTLMSDFGDNFGHWDGDSSSYSTHWEPQPPSPQVLPRYLPGYIPSSLLTFPLSPVGLSTPIQVIEHVALPQGLAAFTAPSTPVSSCPLSPCPATPLSYASPGVEYILLDENYTTVSSVPSPITHPSSSFDIRTQVTLCSGPLVSRSPSLELVYPDLVQVFQSPLLEPLSPLSDITSLLVRLVSPPPCPLSLVSLPSHVATPDSPIDYQRIAEGVKCIDTPVLDLHKNQENLPPPAPVICTPSCINITTGLHPHQFINIQTPQGEEWHPILEFYQVSLNQLPSINHLLMYPLNLSGVTPFRFWFPHYITFYPCHRPLATTLGIPPLYTCSQAILDLPSQDLPLGTIKYNFWEGIRQALAPLNNVIRQAYVGTLVTLELQDFLDSIHIWVLSLF